jgi:hypothetical protein
MVIVAKFVVNVIEKWLRCDDGYQNPSPTPDIGVEGMRMKSRACQPNPMNGFERSRSSSERNPNLK